MRALSGFRALYGLKIESSKPPDPDVLDDARCHEEGDRSGRVRRARSLYPDQRPSQLDAEKTPVVGRIEEIAERKALCRPPRSAVPFVISAVTAP